MQIDNKEMYKLASKRNGKPESLYKDIGNYIFQEAAKLIREAPSLIVKLRHIGSWYLRRKRIITITKLFPVEIPNKEDYFTVEEYEMHLAKRKKHENFLNRVAEYEIYVKEKAEIKKRRNEIQKNMGPPNREDPSQEPGKGDN